jgi:lipopolysaccharide biosynthesis glycosyltransferase
MELHTLICKRDLHSGAACLDTVVEALGAGVQLHLHDDGTLAPEDWDFLLKALPGATKWARAATEEQILERLSRFPACQRYRKASPMGFKLFDIPLLCASPVLSYMDSDIVFFRRVQRLFPPDSKVVTYLQSDEEGFCAPAPELHWKWKIPLVVGLNAGLLQLPMAVYDLDRIEWFLREVSERKNVWRTEGLSEQTAWAMLAAQRPAFHFSQQQFHCSRFKKLEFTDSLVAVHCIYHLKPWIEKLVPKARRTLAESEPVTLAWKAAKQLSGFHILLRRLGRVRRKLVSDEFPGG